MTRTSILALRAAHRLIGEALADAIVAEQVNLGKLKPVGRSTATSFIVGRDEQDGLTTRAQVWVRDLNGEDESKFTGLKVGDKVQGNGATMTVEEIYEPS